jgi:serine/threonine protein kinase
MLACERGCPDTVALLVDAGCDTGARNSHGRTGWELAKLCEHTQVTHLLELYAYGGKAKKGDREGNGDQARSEIGYDELLAQVGLEGKKQEMADSGLAKGVEVMQLQQWDESELKEKILESKELDLTDEQKTKFKAAVLALPYKLMPHKDLEEEFRQLKAKPMETQRQEDGEISDMRLHVWHTVEGRPSFENFEPLSSGTYGYIFKVNDVFPLLEVNGERVSTVVLKAVKRGAGAEAVTALGNETRALMELDNPYIVSVYGFSRTAVPQTDKLKPGPSAPSGASDAAQTELKASKGDSGQKQYVLLLQLCDGDLNKVIHKADSWRVKWRYALEMAKGLAYIHARGQAHLDIKPGNIFLRERQKKDDEAAAAAAPAEPAVSAATAKEEADTGPYQVHVGDFGMDSNKSIDEKKCGKMSVDQLRWTWDKWFSKLDGEREGLTKTLLDREKQKDTDRDTVSEEPVAEVQRADDSEQSDPGRHLDDDSDLPVCEKRHERRKEIESLRTFEQLQKHSIVAHLRGRERDQVDELVNKHASAPAAEKKELTAELKARLLSSREVKPKPVGTYDYMALEAYEGFPEAASDAFSYGVMLWELVTRKPVRQGFLPDDDEGWPGGITYDATRTCPYEVQAEQIPDRFYRSNRRPTMYKWVPEPMKRLIERAGRRIRTHA